MRLSSSTLSQTRANDAPLLEDAWRNHRQEALLVVPVPEVESDATPASVRKPESLCQARERHAEVGSDDLIPADRTGVQPEEFRTSSPSSSVTRRLMPASSTRAAAMTSSPMTTGTAISRPSTAGAQNARAANARNAAGKYAILRRRNRFGRMRVVEVRHPVAHLTAAGRLTCDYRVTYCPAHGRRGVPRAGRSQPADAARPALRA